MSEPTQLASMVRNAVMAVRQNEQSGDWAARFQQLTGKHPSQLGIVDEAAAQRHLILLEQMRSATPGGGSDFRNKQYSGAGGRNESIYPEK